MTTTLRRSAIIALLAALLLPFAVRPADAAVDPRAEQRFLELLNTARADAGAARLAVTADLVAVARAHSADMAAQGRLHHNPELATDVDGWQKVGENVGRGPQVDAIHDAFLASDGHRRNMLDRAYTEVGIGVEVVGGRVWVTVVFRDPLGDDAPAEEVGGAAPAREAKAAPALDRTTVLLARLRAAQSEHARHRVLGALRR